MAQATETIRFLQRVPLFHGLNDRQLRKLAVRCVEREYAAGQSIVAQGQGGEGFFLVVTGQAKAMRHRSDGSEVLVNTFGPTDFFGELALLYDGARTATVIATEPTECLALTRWDFIGTLKEDAEMAVVIAQALAERFHRALDALQ